MKSFLNTKVILFDDITAIYDYGILINGSLPPRYIH